MKRFATGLVAAGSIMLASAFLFGVVGSIGGGLSPTTVDLGGAMLIVGLFLSFFAR